MFTMKTVSNLQSSLMEYEFLVDYKKKKITGNLENYHLVDVVPTSALSPHHPPACPEHFEPELGRHIKQCCGACL